MESFRLPYKSESYGNPIYVRVYWQKMEASLHRPIALIYHAGGLVVGSSESVPKPQIDYLCSKGFVVVIPNYRLVPQVTGKEAFADSEEAFDWTTSTLPGIMGSKYSTKLDTTKVVALGHSSGGSMALHLASFKPLKAVTAFYPFIFVADTSTNAHKPTDIPPFGTAPEFVPTEDDWAAIQPPGHQLSEMPIATPDTSPSAMKANPRARWMMHIFRTGQWLSSVQPDGDFAAIDPMTKLHAGWPPTMIIHGEQDYVPGRSLELVRRAESEMRRAGIDRVQLQIVEGAGHLFDHSPAIGNTDLGSRWQATVKGLDWLCDHI